MKILYFVNYFPPLIGAAAINSQKIAEYLVKLGHDIVVLAPNEMGNVFNIKKHLHITTKNEKDNLKLRVF